MARLKLTLHLRQMVCQVKVCLSCPSQILTCFFFFFQCTHRLLLMDKIATTEVEL